MRPVAPFMMMPMVCGVFALVWSATVGPVRAGSGWRRPPHRCGKAFTRVYDTSARLRNIRSAASVTRLLVDGGDDEVVDAERARRAAEPEVDPEAVHLLRARRV